MTPVDIDKLKERYIDWLNAQSGEDDDIASEIMTELPALIAKAERVDAMEAALREIAKPGCGAGHDWGDDERADYWSNQAIRCRSLARNTLSPKPEISDPTKRMEKILGAKFVRRDNALSPKESEK